MQYRPLGRTGVMVSPLCLGGWNFGAATDKATATNMIRRAIDAGINFIDTANAYHAGESERIIGQALKESGYREKVVLATKAYFSMGNGPNEQGASRYHIIKACEDSLQRLQTDHIDLYQLHRPSLAIPQDETLRAFDDLIRAGKVRYIGCSTFPAWLVMEALAISEKNNLARYISEQPPYNLLDRRIENELIPLCQKYGIAILPWSPLAGGTLAGRYPPGEQIAKGSRFSDEGIGAKFQVRLNDPGRVIGQQIVTMAQERNLTPAQLALLWVKDQPGVTAPIIGPRTMAQLEDAIPVLNMTLDDADRPLFDELVHPGTAVADFHSNSEWMKARILS